MTEAFLVKNSKTKRIDSSTAIELIRKYTVVGQTYNQFGQVLYLRSAKGNRIHSLLLSTRNV